MSTPRRRRLIESLSTIAEMEAADRRHREMRAAQRATEPLVPPALTAEERESLRGEVMHNYHTIPASTVVGRSIVIDSIPSVYEQLLDASTPTAEDARRATLTEAVVDARKEEAEQQPLPLIDTLKIPLELTFPNHPNCYVLVGAGGTGARVAALLPKIIKREDSVIVFDHDTVEPKNLIRQHFVHEDVGKNKAVVTAARLKRALIPALRDAVQVEAAPEKISSHWTTRYANLIRGKRMVYVGCVDNATARHKISRLIPTEHGHRTVWLDSGNLLRHGQVILAGLCDYVDISRAYIKSRKLDIQIAEVAQEITESAYRINLMYNGVQLHAPELLNASNDDQGPDCAAIILDSQTAAANQMAASIMFNLLSAIGDGLPITAPYYSFSTVPPMVKAEEWRKGGVNKSRYYGPIEVT